ncbi:MAG: hypothetical protein ACYC7E_09525 [Armatimonadota bacterium]
MQAQTIDRIVGGGLLASDYAEAGEGVLERKVEALQRAGVTHVVINQALVSIPWVMDPENSYLRFTTLGPTPDQFVTSTYNVGLFHESLLAQNRKLLLANAALARKYGFRCAILCVEMTFMPESFFRRYPALRGARVDNPACSTTPLYALCPMLPEVQDHYSQLITGMLELVPEIDEMHIFTNDSGGGFCYSKHLYAGPNGPYHCQDVPTGQQAQVFAQTLINAARNINTDFRVVMTSGLSPKEKHDFIRNAPDGAASSVYGAFAWGGGLEDWWGTQAIGPAVHTQPEERAKVRAWQDADYETRVRQIRENGGLVYANYSPYYYAGDDPRPWETHEVICKLLRWGVTNIIGGAGGGEYSANSAVLLDAVRNGIRPTDQVVRELAERWVGTEMAPRLLEAWRLTERAAREKPVPPGGHFFVYQPLVNGMPLVPDESLLGEHDLDYFLTPVIKDQSKMKDQQGGIWRVVNYTHDDKVAYLRQYDEVVFPSYAKATAILNDLLARPDLTDAQRACLETQLASFAGYVEHFRRQYHWIQASFYRLAGETVPPGTPAYPEIIDAEVAASRALLERAGKDPDADPRIQLMLAHRNDSLVKVDLTEFPFNQHLGTKGWTGAHEVDE